MYNEIMKGEFLELFNKWHSSYMFSVHGSADPRAKEHYEKLKKWCGKRNDENLLKERKYGSANQKTMD